MTVFWVVASCSFVKFTNILGELIAFTIRAMSVPCECCHIYLQPAVYSSNELWSRLGQPGVAVGLSWTAVGGEVLLVEASKMEGDGELVLTGHLGDVMKESAKLALNWVRTSAREVRHIHVAVVLPKIMIIQTLYLCMYKPHIFDIYPLKFGCSLYMEYLFTFFLYREGRSFKKENLSFR
jgi:hypothetical protein